MKIEFTRNEINYTKQGLTCIAMLAGLAAIIYYDIEAYKFVMMAIGGLSVGIHLGNWARKKWPTT